MAHPNLVFCPYLPLNTVIEFANWRIGPLDAFEHSWPDPKFKAQAEAFLAKFVDQAGERIERPSVLCRRNGQIDGQRSAPEENRGARGCRQLCVLFNAALDVFNDRPRRGRDAVANAFDAMEAAAKIRLTMPNATFGQVLACVEANRLLNDDGRKVLSQLKELRNHQFGHGTPFTLTEPEIDFVYVTCAASARLFARL